MIGKSKKNDLLKFLIKKGVCFDASVITLDVKGHSPLFYALINKNIYYFEKLIKASYPHFIEERSLFHEAISLDKNGEFLPLIKLLVENKYPLYLCKKYYNKPSVYALLRGKNKLALFLTESSADVSSPNNSVNFSKKNIELIFSKATFKEIESFESVKALDSSELPSVDKKIITRISTGT